MKALDERPARRPRLWLGALVAVGLVGLGLGVRFTVGKMRVVTAVQAPTVTWAPASNPANAQVIRKKDGKVLCLTPCRIEVEPGVGRMPVIFRLAGHADEELVLDETQNFGRTVMLQRETASVTPPVALPVKPPTEPPTPPASDAIVAGTAEPAGGPAVPMAVDKSAPNPRVNTPMTRPVGGPKRGPSDPALGKPVKLPTLPISRRPGTPAESVLTDDKIEIIQ